MHTDEWRTRLEGLRTGNLQSFRWVYDRCHPQVYGFSLKLLKSPTAAEEVTSDVFVRLWKKRAVVDPDRTLSPLLFKITKDLAWNYLKRENRLSRQQEQYAAGKRTAAPASVEADLVLNDYIEIAETAIQRLPDRQREIFILHYKSGLDNETIASRLGIAEATVRVHLSRASHYLRDYLNSHPELPLLLLLALGSDI